MKLFEPRPSSSDPSGPPCSRRVVLGNLPPGVTAAQVLRAIRGHITSVAMLQPRLSRGDTVGSSSSCLLEFADPEAAATLSREAVLSRGRRGLLYEGVGGHIYRATAWRIPTPSFRHGSHEEARMPDVRQTRTLAVRNLPETAMSRFLHEVGGAQAVVDARRAGAELVVEFATVREAARVARLTRAGALADWESANGRPLTIRVVCDVYARGEAGARCGGLVAGHIVA
ncbi:hypothetical protein ESCO_004459 [Escovopsis weberi]|uniref:RRM domain-containing protein n=1 Tax=Escovopsis weberi TaxID=150374 RepID=A0A0N0RTT1_ESCWE|nr:hypothetical protein ESCO_004459 [Escovopsis weberi]